MRARGTRGSRAIGRLPQSIALLRHARAARVKRREAGALIRSGAHPLQWGVGGLGHRGYLQRMTTSLNDLVALTAGWTACDVDGSRARRPRRRGSDGGGGQGRTGGDRTAGSSTRPRLTAPGKGCPAARQPLRLQHSILAAPTTLATAKTSPSTAVLPLHRAACRDAARATPQSPCQSTKQANQFACGPRSSEQEEEQVDSESAEAHAENKAGQGEVTSECMHATSRAPRGCEGRASCGGAQP